MGARARQIERVELADDAEGTGYSEFHTKLRPNADQRKPRAKLGLLSLIELLSG